MYALRRTVKRDQHFRLPPYASRCKDIGIESLERRRTNQSVFFIFDLLRERIKAPILRSFLTINEPTRELRDHDMMLVDFHRTQYAYHEPIDSMCRAFNQFSHLYDDVVSRDEFRKRVKFTMY